MPIASRLLTIGVFLALFLSACGSSPPVHYFALNPIDSEFQPGADDAMILGLGPLRLPDYLNRSQLVTRGEDFELLVDEYNRWAEPLSISLLRILAADIDNQVENVVVVMYPFESAVRNHVEFRLLGDINRFDANATGEIVLDVQWGITGRDGDILVALHRSRYRTQAGQPVDAHQAVMAMNDALAQFGRDIAEKLKAALRDSQ